MRRFRVRAPAAGTATVALVALLGLVAPASASVEAARHPRATTTRTTVVPSLGSWTIDDATAETVTPEVVPGAGPASVAFDTCETPTVTQMRAWRRNSPFGTVGIYIGGVLRHCANAGLRSPAWVSAVVVQGWHLLPIYVGPQAPCTSFRVVIDAAHANANGHAAARDAVKNARVAGIPEGAPIYYDLEGYRDVDAGCDLAVRQFITGWVDELHTAGYVAGLYSAPWAGIRVLYEGRADPSLHNVDAVWIAAWTGKPDPYGVTTEIPVTWWGGARSHQYRGDHDETWGGVTLNVDSNVVGGPVYPAVR